jgi:LysM repeat protein
MAGCGRERWRLLLATLPALLLILLPATSRAQDDPRTHTVKKGEAIYLIAKKYGCSVDEVFAANQDRVSSPTKIFPGQVLTIPNDCTGKKTGKAKKARRKDRKERKEKYSRCRDCRWDSRDVNSKTLKRKMKKKGFKAPPGFRALVVKTTLSKDKKSILKHQLFDYGGYSMSHRGWNPASTIKLFSGVSALERLKELGFSPKAKVTFHYDSGDKTFKVEDLYEKAVHLSKNIEHNRLTQLAGFDRVNGRRGTLKRAGLDFSYVMRAYEQSNWAKEGHPKSLNWSPKITVREGKRKKVLKARKSKKKYPCHSAACTSLSDLSRMMCNLMLHEQLPKGERLNLGSGRGQGKHLLFIRRKLNRKRRGKKDPVWDVLERHFIPKAQRKNPVKGGYQLFRKGGYSQEWLSENMYIYLPHGRTRWIVSMAGHKGRTCLTQAADIIAQLIKDGEL